MSRKKKTGFRNTGGRRSVAQPPLNLEGEMRDLDRGMRATELAMELAPTVLSRIRNR